MTHTEEAQIVCPPLKRGCYSLLGLDAEFRNANATQFIKKSEGIWGEILLTPRYQYINRSISKVPFNALRDSRQCYHFRDCSPRIGFQVHL